MNRKNILDSMKYLDEVDFDAFPSPATFEVVTGYSRAEAIADGVRWPRFHGHENLLF